MKKLLLLLLCISMIGFGQTFAQTSVYLEIGGAAGLWSLNYDREIWEMNENFRLHVRGGLGMYSESNGAGFPDVIIPISNMVLFGEGTQRVEAGGGITYYNWTLRDALKPDGFSRRSDLLGHLILGYRFQKSEGGLMFRVAYTPIIINYSNKPFEHWTAGSIGYAF